MEKIYCKNCKHLTEVEITKKIYVDCGGYACKLGTTEEENCIGIKHKKYFYGKCLEKNKDYNCNEYEKR